MKEFWATEAALNTVKLAYNLYESDVTSFAQN
jgi:hypothetical protein